MSEMDEAVPLHWDTVREAYDALLDIFGPLRHDEFMLKRTAIASALYDLYSEGYEDGLQEGYMYGETDGREASG